MRIGPFADQVHLLHTHSGPALRECLQDYYAWDDAAGPRRQYTLALEKAIVEKIASALGNMSDATIWATEGTADFAVNRRNNDESQIDKLLARGEPLKGPVDHRVPLLAVRGSDGRLRAVVFGYACHTSMLARTSGQATTPVSRSWPWKKNTRICRAMFYQACGGDQGAMPRRTVELTQKNGLKLAAAVERALAQPMRPVAPRLKTAFELVTLPFEKTILPSFSALPPTSGCTINAGPADARAAACGRDVSHQLPIRGSSLEARPTNCGSASAANRSSTIR